MKRRDFIKLTSTSSAFMLFPPEIMAILKNFNVTTCPNNSSKKLVLIQLSGANDGLNTIIPINQYDLYANYRPKIKLNLTGNNAIIPLDNTLGIKNQISLHPALIGFKDLYEKGLMRIVQGVGYPKQNKSHFKSTDLWLSGGDGEPENSNENSGWMGRFLENNYSELISNPNYPLGIQFGASDNSLGLHGKLHNNLSMNLNQQDLNGFYSIINGLSGETPKKEDIPNSEYGNLLKFIIENDKKTNTYSNTITNSFTNGVNTVSYPESFLSDQLKTVAKLISGGLESKIYLVKIGGFDTHDAQVEENATHTGRHANLLKELSEAINSFITDINNQNLGDDVIGVTFSEFGRKILENGSLGTDHGEVAPMFLFGKPVNPGISGTNIDLSEATSLNNFQVNTVQHDYRQVFSTILHDWLGAKTEVVDYTFFDNKNTINFSEKLLDNIIKSSSIVDTDCGSEDYSLDKSKNNISIEIFPNPSSSELFVRSNDNIRNISIYNMNGALIKNWTYSNQPVEVNLKIDKFIKGIYILEVINENGTKKSKQIIINK